MKVTIFNSWQSDLPNNKNRGFIENALQKARKRVLEDNRNISEIEIISDSRGEEGTPDLVESIFSKIDSCDIFVADISIINPNAESRVTPNPNVLIELGYAARTLGWNKIICVFNAEYSQVEKLPFDIRTRKPLIYDTSNPQKSGKIELSKMIAASINEIFNNVLIDKYEYSISKRTIDLAMQALLIDFCRFVFPEQEKYRYDKLLRITREELSDNLMGRQILGFYLFRNILQSIEDFSEYFNDGIATFFLSNREKRVLAKLVYSLKAYEKMLRSENVFERQEEESNLKVISGRQIDRRNPEGTYLLVRPIDSEKFVVVASGEFGEESLSKLLCLYKTTENNTLLVTGIYRIIQIINEWIAISGQYFIANMRELQP